MLTGQEMTSPVPVNETVPEGPVDPERTFLADPTVEPTGSDFPDAGQTILDTDPETSSTESELKHFEEVERFESRLSADPVLHRNYIVNALEDSFQPEMKSDQLEPVSEDADLPFGNLLTFALDLKS